MDGPELSDVSDGEMEYGPRWQTKRQVGMCVVSNLSYINVTTSKCDAPDADALLLIDANFFKPADVHIDTPTCALLSLTMNQCLPALYLFINVHFARGFRVIIMLMNKTALTISLAILDRMKDCGVKTHILKYELVHH